MQEAVDQFLRNGEWHPILVDVGASGASPGIWEPIARHAVHVAFDPDLREMKQSEGAVWHRSTIINEVIASDPSLQSVQFNLTRSPYCSSTLQPDAQLVANFLEPERFEVLRQASCKATTLDAVLTRLGLDRIDWLKLDTQGTDLRIFNSLSPATKSKVLAVDLEPGLRGAYQGEDTFGEIHRDLRRDGFWLSDSTIKGLVRMRASTLAALRETGQPITREEIEKAVRKAPGWIEIRYLRTLESLAQHSPTQREYQLLWLFAMLDGHFGFALDVAAEYASRFSTDSQHQIMQAAALQQIRDSLEKRRQAERWANASLPRRVLRKITNKLRGPGH